MMKEHKERLEKLLPNAIISDEKKDLEVYRDIGYSESQTRLVVRVSTYDGVSSLLSYCNEHTIAVVPWGGGTNLCGALTPSRECIALDMKSLNAILDFSEEDWHVTVQAGTAIEKVERHLNRFDFTFCHDPWSRRSSTVGGALSLDSVGNFYPKFGSIGDQALSMKVALPNGRIITVGRNLTKTSSSPFLPSLFIGAEGLYGIILEATLRVKPLAETFSTLGYAFSSFTDLFESLRLLSKKGVEPQSYIGGTLPARVVKLQPKSERMLVRLLKINAALFLYYDGLPGEVEARISRAKQLLNKYGRKMPEKYSVEWWENRHTYFEMSPELANEGLYVYVFDLCVPPGIVPKMVKEVEQLGKKLGMTDRLSHTLFGAVDAYTVALYIDDTPEGRETIKRFEKELVPIVHTYNGTITRTHGLGTLFDDGQAIKEIGEDGFYLLKGMKDLLDPNRILNPGVLHRGI